MYLSIIRMFVMDIYKSILFPMKLEWNIFNLFSRNICDLQSLIVVNLPLWFVWKW